MATIVTGEQVKQIWGKLGEIQRQIHQPGGYPYDFGSLLETLQSVIEGKFNLPPSLLPNLILAAGFDWWNKDILKWQREDAVPTTLGEGELLHLNRHISTDEAEAETKQRGYRSANAEELCDYATKNPDEQRKYPIIALGSVFVDPASGHRYSPFLYEDGAGRELNLDGRDGDWSGYCRFLAVRK